MGAKSQSVSSLMRRPGALVAERLTHFRDVLRVETVLVGRRYAPEDPKLITDEKWIFPSLHYFKGINSAISVGRDVQRHQKNCPFSAFQMSEFCKRVSELFTQEAVII